MSLLTLHHAIHNANINIRKATKASDDYMHATTEVLFNALWDIAPSHEYSDTLWNVSLGGDVSGSWIAATRGEYTPYHRYLLLSSCNKSVIVAHDLHFGKFGIYAEDKTFRILPNLGDELREIIHGVILAGDFHGDELSLVTPPGIKLPPRNPEYRPTKLTEQGDAKTFSELPTPDEWVANLAKFLSTQPIQGRAEDVDLATFKEPIKEGFIPGELVGRCEAGTLSLTGACRQLTDLDPERRQEIIDNILGSKPGVLRTANKPWQPTGGKELVKNLREYQEEQRSGLPRDAEGNVADFVPDDSPTR